MKYRWDQDHLIAKINNQHFEWWNGVNEVHILRVDINKNPYWTVNGLKDSDADPEIMERYNNLFPSK